MGLRARLGFACLVGVTAAVMATSALAAGGNSSNAALCQDWRTLYRADGTPFKNQGECVSYAAQGGAPQATFLGWTVGDCPITTPTFCLFLSGVGLKPGAAGTAFEVEVDNVHGVATFPVPTADANGAIASTPVVITGLCGGSVTASITYLAADETPITADILFDVPACPA